MSHASDDTRIREIKKLLPPEELIREFSLTASAVQLTLNTREAIHGILAGTEHRLLVVIGPCSIHEPDAAWETMREGSPMTPISTRVTKSRTDCAWRAAHRFLSVSKSGHSAIVVTSGNSDCHTIHANSKKEHTWQVGSLTTWQGKSLKVNAELWE